MVYSRSQQMEGQEVLAHFLVASIHLLFCIHLFTRIHWGKKRQRQFSEGKSPAAVAPA